MSVPHSSTLTDVLASADLGLVAPVAPAELVRAEVVPTNGAALVATLPDAGEPTAPPLPDVVLVRGCPRSGTTMIAQWLNLSDRAAVMFEYSLGELVHDLEPIFAYSLAHRAERAKLTRGAVRSDESAYYNAPKYTPVVRHPVKERLAEIVAGVVQSALRKRDVTLIGSKTPGPTALGDRAVLEPLFDTIKYVFVVRNPLRTINSILNRRNLARQGLDVWPFADVHAAIAEYRSSVSVLLSHCARYPDACFVVKYEDMVERFDETAAALGAFLGIEPSPQRLRELIVSRPANTRDILEHDERTAVMTAFGSAIAGWNRMELCGADPDLGEKLSACASPIAVGQKYEFAANSGRPFLGLGWSVPEPAGVWTDDHRADLFFTTSYQGDVVAYLRASFFLPPGFETLSLRIEGNGTEVFRGTCLAGGEGLVDATDGTVHVFTGPGPRALVCGPIRFTGRGIQRLTLHIDDPRSPRQAGLTTDDRRLGVFLHSLVLAPA